VVSISLARFQNRLRDINVSQVLFYWQLTLGRRMNNHGKLTFHFSDALFSAVDCQLHLQFFLELTMDFRRLCILLKHATPGVEIEDDRYYISAPYHPARSPDVLLFSYGSQQCRYSSFPHYVSDPLSRPLPAN